MTLTRPGIVASGWLAADGAPQPAHDRHMGRAMLTSMLIHGVVFLSLVLAVAVVPKEVLNSVRPSFDLIYLPAESGPGGGGGGNPTAAPPKRMEVPAHQDPTTVPIATEKPAEPLPPLLASIQTNTTDLLQATGNASVSLANVGGGGKGPGLGEGEGPGAGPGRNGGSGGGDVYAPGNGVTMPVSLFEAKPIYTPEGMRQKIQGDVTLEVVVLADGTVGQVRVIQSLDRASGIDNAAIESARKWRFKPGMKDGKPVATIVRMIVSFRLH